MSLSGFGIRRPVAAIMIFTGLLALGVVALMRLGLDHMPRLDVPVITVVTIYPGAGPREVEKRVTEELESQLSAVSGLDAMESSSREGVSMIALQFDWGTELATAANDVRDMLAQAGTRLPEQARRPYIVKLDLSRLPIKMLAYSASGPSRDGLRELVEERVADALKRIDGVGQIQVMGGRQREIRVALDRGRLEATGLPLERVMQLLAASNVSVPGGHLQIGRSEFLLRVPGEFRTLAELEQLVVGANPRTGAPVRLRDVADVRDTYRDSRQEVEVNGGAGVFLTVTKQSEANTVEVSRRVGRALERLHGTLPGDVDPVLLRDRSRIIERTVGNLRRTLVWAVCMVMLVLLFFLRNVRASLIVGISIPTALLCTFLLMYGVGYTLNMVSLMSMVIAMGLVVDVSIVVLENIQRHRDGGADPGAAAEDGAREMGPAVIASTLTTLAIFVPMIFTGGFVGLMFGQFSLIVSVCLFSSLAAALILVPTLMSLTRSRPAPAGGLRGALTRAAGGAVGALERAYARLLALGLGRRVLVLGAIVALCGSTLLLAGQVKIVHLPRQDTGALRVSFELPVGTRVAETTRVARSITRRIARAVPEARGIAAVWGADEERPGAARTMGLSNVTSEGVVVVRLVPKVERERSAAQIAAVLRPLLADYPATRVAVTDEDGLRGALFGAGRPISVEIRGHDQRVATRLARRLAREMERIRGLVDVEISRKEGLPELQLDVDRDKAAALGVNVARLAATVRHAVHGRVVSRYRAGGDEIDIRVQLRQRDRRTVADLGGLSVRSATGKLVPLANLVTVRRGSGPVAIERKDQERVIKVEAGRAGRDLGSVRRDLDRALARLTVPTGFSVTVGGASAEQRESFDNLFVALLLGILLVYMVMAAQFGSLRDPFVILFAVPFALVGALWAFLLSGEPLSVTSYVGLIMLVGIVVNNGIVLVDTINQLRARGIELDEAVYRAGRSRLRPVLTTVVTTICGILPMALNTGHGAELWRGMAFAVIGGLAVSTLVTLVFVPLLYHVLARGFSRRRAARSSAVAPAEGEATR